MKQYNRGGKIYIFTAVSRGDNNIFWVNGRRGVAELVAVGLLLGARQVVVGGAVSSFS